MTSTRLARKYSMGEKGIPVQEMGATPAKIDEVVAIIQLANGDAPASGAGGDEQAGIGVLILVIPMLS